MDSTNTTSATVITKLKTLLALPEATLDTIPMEMLLTIEESLMNLAAIAEQKDMQCHDCHTWFSEDEMEDDGWPIWGVGSLCKDCNQVYERRYKAKQERKQKWAAWKDRRAAEKERSLDPS